MTIFQKKKLRQFILNGKISIHFSLIIQTPQWISAFRLRDRVLLYLHGNGSNISPNIGRAKRSHRRDFSVLLID